MLSVLLLKINLQRAGPSFPQSAHSSRKFKSRVVKTAVLRTISGCSPGRHHAPCKCPDVHRRHRQDVRRQRALVRRDPTAGPAQGVCRSHSSLFESFTSAHATYFAADAVAATSAAEPGAASFEFDLYTRTAFGVSQTNNVDSKAMHT